jgi:hypothetical protein
MSSTLRWFLASDGVTPADGTSGKDMSVALVTQTFAPAELGCYLQFVWPATGSPAGSFGYQTSGDGVNWDTGSTASADQTPTSPTGAAGSTSFSLPVGTLEAPAIRGTWTPTSGGTGAVPSGTFNTK